MKKAYLYFENGTFLEALSFGSNGTEIGEVVFNTSMSGYQEIITDPSYAGQLITFTMPEIGIVGTNNYDNERELPHCKGIFVRNYQDLPSNFRAQDNLRNFLCKHHIMGICNLDTRGITTMIRREGAMMAIVSTEMSDPALLKEHLKQSPQIEEINYIPKVSTQKEYIHSKGTFCFSTMDFQIPQIKKTVIAIDFGAKDNILNELAQVGLQVIVRSHHFKAQEIISQFQAKEIQGVFLSNGPGDPMVLKDEIKEIQKLIQAKIPIFGICLGHQLLSIAHGFPTEKLKFGHHGGNHPVKNLKTGEVEITAQNHNYSVTDQILEVAEVTHRNLFDGTIEGVRYKHSPIFSVQYHPEASPGPKDSLKLFKEFAQML